MSLGERFYSQEAIANSPSSQVNVPKTRRTYCKGRDCKKHTQHKVTQYKAGKVRLQPSPWGSREPSELATDTFFFRFDS